MGSLLGFGIANVLLLLIPPVASANAQPLAVTEVSGSIDACHTPAAQVEEIVKGLSSDGWMLLPAGKMPTDVVELLIWPQIVFYTTGDTGGAELASLADIQRKTVAGFARKKDIPQSKTRILTRKQGAQAEAAMVLWQQPVPHQTIVICRFALSDSTVAVTNTPSFGTAHMTDTSDANTRRTATLTLMNPAALSTQIGAPVTPTATLQTQLIFTTQN